VVRDESEAPDRLVAMATESREFGQCEVLRVDLGEPLRPLEEGLRWRKLELLVYLDCKPLGRQTVVSEGRVVSVRRLADELAAWHWHALVDHGAAIEGAGYSAFEAGMRERRGPDQPERESLPEGVPVSILLATCGRAESLRVAPRDFAGLRRSLESLCASAALRRELGEAARDRLESYFTWSRVASQYAALYAETLATSR